MTNLVGQSIHAAEGRALRATGGGAMNPVALYVLTVSALVFCAACYVLREATR